MRETWVWSLSWEDSLEKGKATHSSLAWRIPWTAKRWTWLSNLHNEYTYIYIVCIYIYIYIYIYTYHIFIHSSIDGHVGCFHILTVVNRSTMTLGCVCPSKLVLLLFFSGYVHRSEIAVSNCSSIFSLLRNLQVSPCLPSG